VFCNPHFLTVSKVVSFDHMNTGGRKLKRKRTPSKSFGELVRKLLQPESEELGPKIATKTQRKTAAEGKRGRKR
jgi:hypothetical protein